MRVTFASKKWIVYFLCWCFTAMLFGQTINKNEELHLQIEQLLQEKNVIAVNKLIKENNSLKVSYVLKVLTENLKIAKGKKDPKSMSNTYLTLGNFWHTHDNKVKAFEYYLQSERISKNQNDYLSLGISLMNRSTLLEDNRSRIQMVKQAVKAFEKTDNILNLAKAHLNTGIAYSKFVETEINDSLLTKEQKRNISDYRKKAFNHYAIAESLNTTLNSNDIAGAINTYYAEWYRYEDNLIKAKEHFIKGKNYFKVENNLKGAVYSTIEIARIELKLGNTQEAFGYLKIAEEKAEKYQFKKYLKDIYQLYVSIYEERENLIKALGYQKLLTNIEVELTNLSNQDQLHILSLENELTENQYKFEKLEAEGKLNKLLVSASVFSIILILILAYFVIKNKRSKIESIEKTQVITQLEKDRIETELKNQKLEEDLLKEKIRFSQEHLIQFANQVNKIEGFLDLLKSKLRPLIQNSDQREVINTLKLSFSEVLNGQNHLKQLNSYTSQLNQEFFFYLNKNYPSISKDDEQLLAYIILDMDSKEISRILNITTDSVYKKRYRLRKKLELDNTMSFQEFYDQITSEF